MDDDLIEIVKPGPFKGFVNRACGGLIAFQLCRHLAGDKQPVARHTAAAHAFTDTAFIFIGLCGVDKTVAELYGIAHGLSRLVVLDQPGAEPSLGMVIPFASV